MRHRSLIFSEAVALFLAAGLMGCPGFGGQDTFDVWLVNKSGGAIITKATLTNDSDGTQTADLVQNNLTPGSSRLVSDVEASPFAGSTATIEIVADVPAPGFGQRFSTTVDVQIDEAIQAGDAIPIATSGFFDSEFEAEFVPLDGQSKLQSLIDSLPGQAAAD